MLELSQMGYSKAIFVAFAFFLFTFGYVISGGFYHIGELILILFITFTLAIFYFRQTLITRLSIPKDKATFIFLLKLILLVNVGIMGAKLGDSAQTNWMFYSAINRVLAAGALVFCATFLISGFSQIQRVRLPALLAIAFLMRVVSILAAPAPPTDVFYILRDGPKLLAEGKNPYELSYPAPYGVYIPTIIFHYGPLTPFIFLPSDLLFNDPRPTMIFAEALTVFLIFKIAKSQKLEKEIRNLIILIFVFHPVFSFMTEHSWPESLSTLFIVAAVYFISLQKNLALASLALGTLLAIKSVYVLPLVVFLILIKSKLRNILLTLAIPLIASLPFLFINYQLFLERTQIYVTDPDKIATVLAPTNISLSISAVILKFTKTVLPTYLAVIPALLVSAFLILKRQEQYGLSILGIFLVFMTLFMFGPFAFLYNFAMMGNILLLSVLYLVPTKS